ncbi:MAG: hypothetical protein L0Z62_23340 [Gemmataceae bacterium]|nr:hypothetical protein [Gemmataceae bacterium]
MPAVTVHRSCEPNGGGLEFDLIDLLRLAEPEVRASTWRCRCVECEGERADELHQVSDSGAVITGDELLRLAAGVYQTIEGDFVAT